MSTPIDPTVMPEPAPTFTWLCRFEVHVDLPSTMPIQDMESAIAFAVSSYLSTVGLPGSAKVQLVATTGNASVADPTQAIELHPRAASLHSKATPSGSL